MAAMTIEETTRVSTNNKEQMSNLLEQQAEARTWRDRITSAPQALKGYLLSVLKWMHAESLVSGANSAYQRGRDLFVRVTGPIRKIGLFNILGALLTCKGGRDILRAAGRTAYRVVSAPVRFVGRVFGWVGRHIGLSNAVDWVDAKYHQAIDYVEGKLSGAMTWLDEREHSGAMRWARPFFQGAVVSRGIRHYAPANLKTPLYIANLFLPAFGVGKRPVDGQVPDGLTTESKLDIVKDAADTAKTEVEDRLGKATEKDADNVTPMPVAKEVIEKFEGTIVGSGKKAHYQRVTKADGTVVYRWMGREYTEAEIPSHVVLADAASTTSPEPPEMNRAARRAEEKAAKAKSS